MTDKALFSLISAVVFVVLGLAACSLRPQRPALPEELFSRAMEAMPPESVPEEPLEPLPPEVREELKEIFSDEGGRALPLNFLPQTPAGDVDWVSAIRDGLIRPIDSLQSGQVPIPALDFNVVFPVRGDLPDVVYPHLGHTLWLDCRNCHPGIFVMQAGANRVTMDAIFKGQFCGQCHGKVAFPLSDCNRCHTRPKAGKGLIRR